MMQGNVNTNCEAVILVVVNGPNNQKKAVKAVIDTGFTGFLSLPITIINQLNLPWSYRDRGTLGDGSETIFDIYNATVIWDGQIKDIEVNAADTEPLIGMSLLYGYKLQINTIENGLVIIESLNQ